MKIVYKEKELNISDLPILATEKYLSTKSSEYGWVINEKYLLPFFLDTRLIFTRMVFTYGLIPRKSNLDLDDEQIFLDTMIDIVKSEKICDFIYKAQSNVIFNVCPRASDCVEWGSYVVDLSLDEEALLMLMHTKHRNVVRKAIKNSVSIKIDENIANAQELIAETMTRQNVIHFPSLEYLQNLASNIPHNICVVSAVLEDKLQGVAIFVYDKETAYYMYGGSSVKPSIGSVNLLHYEAMKHFKDLGVKKYDFVGARINFNKGSKYEGLDRFKNRFGGTLHKGYAFRVILNPLKFKLFNLLSKTYLKVKGFDYIDPIDSIGVIKK